MRQKDESRSAVEKTVRDIKRKTRRHFSAEDKIRIVLQWLRGEESVAEIIRTVEQSVLGVSGTLRQIGIPRATIYNCYNYYLFPY